MIKGGLTGIAKSIYNQIWHIWLEPFCLILFLIYREKKFQVFTSRGIDPVPVIKISTS